MRFQVPQFIGVEDKIFGPLTVKQFIYLAGGAGLAFALYKFLPFFLAILVIVPVVALAAALAFYKINGKPFVFTLEAAIKYLLANKLYTWKRSVLKPAAGRPDKTETEAESTIPRLSTGKLKHISWSLDIKKNIGAGE
jgi:hypothetical protein